jgi:hypothetical protein
MIPTALHIQLRENPHIVAVKKIDALVFRVGSDRIEIAPLQGMDLQAFGLRNRKNVGRWYTH